MSSKITETEQLPEELTDEELNSVAGGKQDPSTSVLTDSNPPAEVPSPSLPSLDSGSVK